MRRGTSGLNLLLGINKPLGMSSHDVVNAVRRAVSERRVGHAGTLDPLATGVLVVGVGQGTRLMGLLAADTKSYVGTICFGHETSTDDAEGEITTTGTLHPELMDFAYAQRILDGFVGEQEQIPPAYSAISVGGKRAYAMARSGKAVELEPRSVCVSTAQVLSVEGEGESILWRCAFTVSKGTYIRALARDIGRAAHSAAHLSELCRTVSGTVTLRSCATLEQIGELGAAGVSSVALDPVKALGLPVHEIADNEFKDVASGKAIITSGFERNKQLAMVRDAKLWGVWEAQGPRLVCKANYPQGIAGVRS